MGSQLDLDQGGTFRQTQRVYLGPSVGWQEVPEQWLLNVTTGGNTNVARGTNMILINFNGAVTLQLPSLKASGAGAQAIPKQFAVIPIVICDVGGFAQAHPITIFSFNPETISGLFSFVLGTNFGSYVIRPNIIDGGGTLIQ